MIFCLWIYEQSIGLRGENCGFIQWFWDMGDLAETMGFAHFGIHLVGVLGSI